MLFSNCSGECCLCAYGGGGCLAGHGDDDFYPASKEQVIVRLDKGEYKEYTQMMKDHLEYQFGYDYDREKPNRAAEWWVAECGGVFCSNCGLFFDDYYGSAPNQCTCCGLQMTTNNEMYVHKEYRLSRIRSINYVEESEYPDWLLKLRRKYTRYQLIKHK